MSELKAIRGGDIHDLVEFGDGSEIYHDETLYYLKNAVDEDLAEKDKELRRQKYKRCLAMARWCCDAYDKWMTRKAKAIGLGMDGVKEYHRARRKLFHYMRWQKRWLELAEKFKEAK